jgi:sortase A
MMSRDWQRWRLAERILLSAGVVSLGVYGASRFYSEVSASRAIQEFEQVQASAAEAPTQAPRVVDGVDVSLWSEKRIREYHQSLTTKKDAAKGVLRIPKRHIEVPVFDGTDELTLNRGVGRVIGTARIGAPGNTAVAGHRDGFFRGLKDIEVGDAIELQTTKGILRYIVEGTEVVSPNDVSVLAERASPYLTLVTCFPFYFVGDAPQRFIVHARLTDNYGPADGDGALTIQTARRVQPNLRAQTTPEEKKQ